MNFELKNITAKAQRTQSRKDALEHGIHGIAEYRGIKEKANGK